MHGFNLWECGCFKHLLEPELGKKNLTPETWKKMIAAFQTPKLPGLKSVTVPKFDIFFKVHNVSQCHD